MPAELEGISSTALAQRDTAGEIIQDQTMLDLGQWSSLNGSSQLPPPVNNTIDPEISGISSILKSTVVREYTP